MQTNKGLTVQTLKSPTEINQEFVSKLPKLDNGSNTYASDFLLVVNSLILGYKSFTMSDCLNRSRGLEIPVEILKSYFLKFVNTMIKEGRLRKLDASMSPYDEIVYQNDWGQI